MPLWPIPASAILASHCSRCRSGVLLTHASRNSCLLSCFVSLGCNFSWRRTRCLCKISCLPICCSSCSLSSCCGLRPAARLAFLAASAAIAASASGDRPEFSAAMLAAPSPATCGRCNRSFWLTHACGQSCLLSCFACLSRHFNQRFTSFFRELGCLPACCSSCSLSGQLWSHTGSQDGIPRSLGGDIRDYLRR